LASGFQTRLERLQRPLRIAARDNFRELEATPNLGVALCRAAREVGGALGEQGRELLDYAAKLEGFDDSSRVERVRLVALGLRLCAGLGSDRPTPTERKSGRSGVTPRSRPGQAGGLAKEKSQLTALRGVGPRVAESLARRGIHAIEDLLCFLPLEYIDRRRETSLDRLVEGQPATTSGVVIHKTTRRARGRRMLEVGLATAPGGRVLLACVWFRTFPGLSDRFKEGERVGVSGVVRRYRDQLQMVHPDLIDDGGHGVRRRYPEVEGVAPRVIERLCADACARFVDEVDDGVPAQVAREAGLPAQADAVRALHLQQRDHEPAPEELKLLNRGVHPAHQRLVFDELFSLQLAVALRKAAWGERAGRPCALSDATWARLREILPFTLTGAQRRCVEELRRDMALARPMHRLLQGDVGSGKTAVAFAAAAAAIDAGMQAAVMAPTEILASQHLQTMEPWARALGWRAAMLTASTPRGVKESLLALADAGQIHLLVGTHALLSPRVSLPDLGLAVVDEQHRFGVLQRVRLRERPPGEPLPHLLLMTATPIPRSMALAVYGDLDLSVVDEKPPGRLPVQTRLYVGREQRRAYDLVGEELRQGSQAFVVCPLVEESDKLDVADAVGTAARLQELFADHRVGLVHGRLGARERAEVMGAFRRHEIDLLVATTVIEVGIDVPRASVMVVEHADRFGLAQLHQLRGRVGRDSKKSHCLLLTDAAPGSVAAERLGVMVRTDDGFEIAEADLRIRGPGEVFGTRQAGLPRLRFADLGAHMRLLALAQRHAAGTVERDPELALPEHQAALRVMRRRWEGIELVGEEAG
jgi:ATP-dependent DNA helicase RecG